MPALYTQIIYVMNTVPDLYIKNKMYSRNPKFRAIAERTIGPSCLGSPAITNCARLDLSLGSISPVIGTMHSGSTAWPPSSIKICVKWFVGNFSLTILQCQGHVDIYSSVQQQKTFNTLNSLFSVVF